MVIDWIYKHRGYILLGLVILPLLIGIAEAHSWYPPYCCNGDGMNGDCHPIACDSIVEHDDGTVSWLHYNFGKHMIYPSQDAQCHVCVSAPDTNFETPHCIFTQQGS